MPDARLARARETLDAGYQYQAPRRQKTTAALLGAMSRAVAAFEQVYADAELPCVYTHELVGVGMRLSDGTVITEQLTEDATSPGDTEAARRLASRCVALGLTRFGRMMVPATLPTVVGRMVRYVQLRNGEGRFDVVGGVA